ncbi:MAG TPA: aldehyde dehydrogenase [Gemmataceae bacterium]|jgi:aminomuconate-semialdehyde/2-hydroxymuconate-6-semialdehyde dehydrogenase
MLQIKNFINGKHIGPVSGKSFAKTDPATGLAVSRVPDSDGRDVEAAVEAATNAFPNWSRTPAAERSRLLLAIADCIDTNLDRLAEAECIDAGKPLRLAKAVDIPRAASNFRFFATAVLHFRSEAYRTDQLALNYTLHQPRGVAGLISPWNLPLYLFSWKVAPALATGNTVVGKPSELTPTTAHLLTELCQDVGLPPGVFNVVHGYGAKVGAALVSHPRVPTLSYTGGTATGAEIAKNAAPLFKKLTLELGGKNPNIIFADADLDEVLRTSIRSSFENQGEICLCGSRIYVEEKVYSTVVERFVAETRKLKVGDPLDPATDQGALISKGHLEKVQSYIRLAKDEGGRILCGGNVPDSVGERCRNGYFLQPTVIVDLDVKCRVNQEEIFGPVLTITPFRTEEEAVRYANATPFGLSASIWTRDLARAHRVAEKIECGTIWVNCWLLRDLRTPFGGMKGSGVGREGGEEALRFFTEPKTVCIKYPTEAT